MRKLICSATDHVHKARAANSADIMGESGSEGEGNGAGGHGSDSDDGGADREREFGRSLTDGLASELRKRRPGGGDYAPVSLGTNHAGLQCRLREATSNRIPNLHFKVREHCLERIESALKENSDAAEYLEGLDDDKISQLAVNIEYSAFMDSRIASVYRQKVLKRASEIKEYTSRAKVFIGLEAIVKLRPEDFGGAGASPESTSTRHGNDMPCFQSALQLSKSSGGISTTPSFTSARSLANRPTQTYGLSSAHSSDSGCGGGGFVSARHLVSDAALQPSQKSKMQQQTLPWCTTDNYIMSTDEVLDHDEVAAKAAFAQTVASLHDENGASNGDGVVVDSTAQPTPCASSALEEEFRHGGSTDTASLYLDAFDPPPLDPDRAAMLLSSDAPKFTCFFERNSASDAGKDQSKSQDDFHVSAVGVSSQLSPEPAASPILSYTSPVATVPSRERSPIYTHRQSVMPAHIHASSESPPLHRSDTSQHSLTATASLKRPHSSQHVNTKSLHSDHGSSSPGKHRHQPATSGQAKKSKSSQAADKAKAELAGKLVKLLNPHFKENHFESKDMFKVFARHLTSLLIVDSASGIADALSIGSYAVRVFFQSEGRFVREEQLSIVTNLVNKAKQRIR